MPALNFLWTVPYQPFLNQPFYTAWGIGSASSFTGAYCSIGSTISIIRASGSSFVAMYPAGTVATGTWTVKGYLVSGSTGTYSHSGSIKVRDSTIADPAKTLYDILRNNVGSTYSTTLFSTQWYNASSAKPQVTVARGGWTTAIGNAFDTQRRHAVTLHVDTWIGDRGPASPPFGATGFKHALQLLDAEVKRIIDANNKAPSAKLTHMMITNSVPLDEVEDARRIFRTRHTVRLFWEETIA